MEVLFVGDIVGRPGRTAFQRLVPEWRRDRGLDLVIANAENAAGGRGPGPSIADALFEAGADVLTLGDHAWDDREMIAHIASERRILRPANMPPGAPGRGDLRIDTPSGPVTVLSLIGRTFMGPNDCPFRAADDALKEARAPARVRIVDFHAEATSEKIAMGRYLDGRAAAVCGTHTHVQTSDERVLPGGTACITDVGMTGPRNSVLGREIEPVLEKFITHVPQRFGVAKGEAVLEAVRITIDQATGRAEAIERIREIVS
ncbi:TIGR00282 family metallophosphoesterase [Kiritimatiella glycovorans]|uniref:Metallophosphoesterase, MG_246/ family n=1 Tax=Kiritimatiella glycovorans TaxID=1307763 RepID=A0A0G3EI73_9BACT|nr:TIGR00282 family metallophosphoesterase [Kiritimatiella glycovorans]AKJ64515.1 metallophosphoesterase, MG_246/ family [Kiritimatiella glycovorans]